MALRPLWLVASEVVLNTFFQQVRSSIASGLHQDCIRQLLEDRSHLVREPNDRPEAQGRTYGR